MTKDEAIATLRAALEQLANGAENVATNAELRGDTYDVGYARAMAKCANEALSAAATTAPSSEPVHFFRQKGEAVWIECATDPRETLASSPAANCFEYRTLYAEDPAAPVVVPEGYVLMPKSPSEAVLAPDGWPRMAWARYQAMISAAPAAPKECQHKRQSTTALGGLTNTGWKCSDCGALVSASDAPDRAAPLNTAAPTGSPK